jgi:predicted phosphoribosyltransferase
MIIHNEHLHNKLRVFKNRYHAGEVLTTLIKEHFKHLDWEVVAVPAGGVPVGIAIAERLNTDLKLIVVSKITFPWTTEAGFGAVNMFGDVLLNEKAIDVFHLSDEVVESQKKMAEKKVERRVELIPKEFLKFERDACIVVDDGLASGYTMLCATRGLKRAYKQIIVAVPTASKNSADMISKECDVITANLRDFHPFAVADAYSEWHDLSEKEMLKMLESYKTKKSKI